MKNFRALFFSLLLLGPLAPAGAQTLPDMKDQASWGEKDKQEFLKFLKSNQQMPVTGQVKDVPAGKGGRALSRRARYLTLNAFSDKMNTGKPSFGPEILAGGHLFSWIRYYGGLKYTGIKRNKLSGAPRIFHSRSRSGSNSRLYRWAPPDALCAAEVRVSEHYCRPLKSGSRPPLKAGIRLERGAGLRMADTRHARLIS